ncbi:MAG: hypothetical protein ISS26_05055 [Candidatus Omnitrophica bacterium]|nr:hypothetical protein [Candidatus Omnitrophota bacterium]
MKIDLLPGKFWVGAKFAKKEGGEKRYLFFEQKGKILVGENFAFPQRFQVMARQTAEATPVITLVGEAVWTSSRCYAFIYATGEEDTKCAWHVLLLFLETLQRAGRRTAEPVGKNF